MGVSPREQEILDLYDIGKQPGEIAADLAVSPNYVNIVLGRLVIGAKSLNHFDNMVAAGSASLLAAIALHHPEMVA